MEKMILDIAPNSCGPSCFSHQAAFCIYFKAAPFVAFALLMIGGALYIASRNAKTEEKTRKKIRISAIVVLVGALVAIVIALIPLTSSFKMC
ncbi:Uncharacterised protein [Candidatus Gugararchaeum adminiculabundum]|nr:Uncharacterised protein [Candidatus Gugararchaeum adminiculabundum]